jgi:signal transduction histidine kinase
MPRLSVRARLLAALTLLAAATLTVGAIAWIGLSRGADRLDRLHGDTLVGVDRALTLSHHAADLATLAPYLLSLDSPFRIAQEGAQAAALLDLIAAGLAADHPLQPDMATTRVAIADLVRDASLGAMLHDRTLRLNADLARAERSFAALSAQPGASLDNRQGWLALQRQAAALLGAGRAENLVGVGEYHREFLALSRAGTGNIDPPEHARLRAMAEGPDGLFEQRRLELASRIRAEAALVRIRQGAAAVTAHSAAVTAEAQAVIAAERDRTSTVIALAKSTILVAGLASAVLALMAALYVSGHVTANLRAISDAMMRLAAGDRQTRLPRGEGAGDEIGKLFHAFRAFRANALRLDRSAWQMAQRTALFDNMMAGISDGVAILSDQGTVVTTNARMAQVLRIDPSQLQNRLRLRDVIAAAGWSEAPRPGGHSDLTLNGKLHAELRESALPGSGTVVLVSDVTERREVEDRLRQIQRIEVLGKVSGEVAHDFGNILSTVSGSLHLMETAPPDRQPALRQTGASAVDLGTSLTQRLLSFARRQRLDPEKVELNALAEGLADLIGFALDTGVDLKLRTHDTPLWVRVDPGQMESAVLNLCLNAGQAIVGAGRVELSVGVDGKQAVISVTDTGVGMTADVLAHAMEPFFTARRDGTGTGLGLAMVYGFIAQSGGDVQIASVPDCGTTVRLSLPLADTGDMSQPVPLPPLGRVLLVEDDPADRAHARTVLEPAARQLTTCADAATALAHLDRAQPDLIVTDLTLNGGAEGWRLAEAALTRAPQARAVVVSGRLPAANPLAARFAGRIATLAKPLTATSLATALNALPSPD